MNYGMKTVIMLTLFLIPLTACSLLDGTTSDSEAYWRVFQNGAISTNDAERLQKEVPFAIILPQYLPGGSKTYELNLDYHTDPGPRLHITYDSLTEAREITINEGVPSDPYPRPLPPGLFAKMNPDMTPIELEGVQVLERVGYDDVIRSEKAIRVSDFTYAWELNGLVFSVSVEGYEQADARRIVGSMIRS